MEITETSGQRFDLAMEILREGNSVSFSGVSFQLQPHNKMLRRVESTWQPERITEESAIQDLKSAEQATRYLCEQSQIFRHLVDGREITSVLFVGYGMGGIEICVQTPSGIVWEKGYPIEKHI